MDLPENRLQVYRLYIIEKERINSLQSIELQNTPITNFAYCMHN